MSDQLRSRLVRVTQDTLDAYTPIKPRLAEAVVAALLQELQLRQEEETVPVVVGRVPCTCTVPAEVVGLHTCDYDSGHFEFHDKSRWVGQWVSPNPEETK